MLVSWLLASSKRQASKQAGRLQVQASVLDFNVQLYVLLLVKSTRRVCMKRGSFLPCAACDAAAGAHVPVYYVEVCKIAKYSPLARILK